MALRLSCLRRFVSNKLLLTLSSPSEAIYVKAPVESVTLPGTEGAFTVTNNHSQVVSQLRNGVVTVRQEGKEPKSFFLSDGFLFYRSPRDDAQGSCTADVAGVEIVPCEFLDKEQAVKTLQELLQSGSASTSQWAKAKVQLGQELCAAVMRAAP